MKESSLQSAHFFREMLIPYICQLLLSKLSPVKSQTSCIPSTSRSASSRQQLISAQWTIQYNSWELKKTRYGPNRPAADIQGNGKGWFLGLWGHCSLQTASEVKSDNRFEISDLDYLHIHVHLAYMVWTLLAASEATMASKQPRRSDLISDLKSVTSITYISMCILIIWYGPFWQPRRPLWPPSSLRGQIWPLI